jgi:hypothetical protein
MNEVMLQPSPLETIADWLLARFPFEAAAAQLGISEQQLEAWLGCLLPEPAAAVLPEPTAAVSEAENRLQREWLRALIAERSDPNVRVDWAERAAHSGTWHSLPRLQPSQLR